MMGTSIISDEAEGSQVTYPIYQPQRTLKVVVIGAGASGLLLAYKLQRNFSNLDLKVFEKNPAVSGTWFENVGLSINLFLLFCRACTRRDVINSFTHTTQTYPGCACDVPAHCKFGSNCWFGVLCIAHVLIAGHRLYVVVRAKD